eukprot:SAG31_NODE_4370_length_3304_cov_2.644618_1_plen_445_part_00
MRARLQPPRQQPYRPSDEVLSHGARASVLSFGERSGLAGALALTADGASRLAGVGPRRPLSWLAHDSEGEPGRPRESRRCEAERARRWRRTDRSGGGGSGGCPRWAVGGERQREAGVPDENAGVRTRMRSRLIMRLCLLNLPCAHRQNPGIFREGDSVWTQTRLRLIDAFRAFDADGSGAVSEEELQKMLQVIPGSSHPPRACSCARDLPCDAQALDIGETSTDGGDSGRKPSAEAVALSRYLMATADQDGDGTLDFREFRAQFDKSATHSHEAQTGQQQPRRPTSRKMARETHSRSVPTVVRGAENTEVPQGVLRRVDNDLHLQQPRAGNELRQQLRSTARRMHTQVAERQTATESAEPSPSEQRLPSSAAQHMDGAPATAGQGRPLLATQHEPKLNLNPAAKNSVQRDKYRGKQRVTGDELKNHLHHGELSCKFLLIAACRD